MQQQRGAPTTYREMLPSFREFNRHFSFMQQNAKPNLVALAPAALLLVAFGGRPPSVRQFAGAGLLVLSRHRSHAQARLPRRRSQARAQPVRPLDSLVERASG